MDTDSGVFYTTNSQRPDACGPRVGDLLSSATVSWGPDHHEVDIAVYDSPTSSVHVDDGTRGGKQLTSHSDVTSAGNEVRGQPTLLVDFH